MGKVLSIIIGLVFLAVGIWGIAAWRAEVLDFLKAAITLMAVIVGLGILAFGLSELRAGDGPPLAEPASPEGSQTQ